MKRRLLFLALVMVIAAGLSLAGCSRESSGGKAVVRVQLIGDFQMTDRTDPVSGETLKGLYVVEQEFERLHPDIDIVLLPMGWDDYQKKTQAMIIANEADVYQVPGIAALSDQGLLENLESYIQRDKFDLGVYIDGQVDGWKTAGPNDQENHIYGLPLMGDTRYIIYDKKIFDDWGVAYLSATPTVEEVLEAARKMTGKNPKTGEQNYGVTIRGRDADDTLVNLNEYFGGSWGSGIRFPDMKVEFNSSTMVKAAGLLKQLLAYAPSGTMQDAGSEKFGQPDNNIAIHLRGNPSITMNIQALGLDSRYTAARLFVHPTLNKGNLFVGSPLAIGSSSTVKDAAWEWIKFTASDFFCEYWWENQKYEGLPVTKHAFDLPGIKDNANYTTVIETLAYLWTPRYLYRAAQPRTILTAAVQNIILNNANIQDALNTAQRETEDWIKVQ
ncbi:MAG: extracellular solute-binding protein [Spirochaetaceae bacterium]|nr:extracellular solute-binding protein [Spirochaetaceae bacterium]